MTLNEHDTGGGDLAPAGDIFRLLWLSTVAIWGSVVGTATLMRNGSFLAAVCRPFAFRTRWLWCVSGSLLSMTSQRVWNLRTLILH